MLLCHQVGFLWSTSKLPTRPATQNGRIVDGHRARLRQRFLEAPDVLSQAELLELLLTYAIPRRGVEPVAKALLARFGSLLGVLGAPRQELESVAGIGESSSALIQLLGVMTEMTCENGTRATQVALWPEPESDLDRDEPEPTEREIRTFGNDEVQNALAYLPQAGRFETYGAYAQFLQESLPYNSTSTRVRRARYLLNRFFPQETLETPLTYFADRCASVADLKSAVFYELLRAEPIAARVAEEVIWPALPRGGAHREALRDCVLKHLPDIKPKSAQKTLRSLINTFALLGVAEEREDSLRFAIHPGTAEGFLYVLAAEFPEPGMYTFEALDDGPMRHWLLWDADWMRGQIYRLRDAGIIAKVSEIDAMRQFTLAHGQMEALRQYFAGRQETNSKARSTEGPQS